MEYNTMESKKENAGEEDKKQEIKDRFNKEGEVVELYKKIADFMEEMRKNLVAEFKKNQESKSEKKKMEDNKTDHSIDQKGRYKFYIDKKATEKHPILIDKEGAGMFLCKLNVLTAETPDVTSKQRKEDLKDKKFIEEIEKRKEMKISQRK